MSPFWTLATSLLAGTLLVISLSFVVYVIHERIMERRRKEAIQYVLERTRKIYFYGSSVSECLRSNAVWELQWRRIGDFARPMGKLVLCALSDSPNDAILYAHLQEKPIGYNCYYEAYVWFFYRKQWWEIDLSRGLMDSNVRLVHVGNIDIIRRREYEQTSFWKLNRQERNRLEECSDRKKSYLEPDTRYAIAKDDEAYQDCVQVEVWHIVEWWQYCEQQSRATEYPEDELIIAS